MLTLFYGSGACSMASHIVLEESGEKYEGRKVNLAQGEQRSPDYLKVNPHAKVPALKLDDSEVLTENAAILPYLGKRFRLWPKDAKAESRAHSWIGYFSSTVHPAHTHVGRSERFNADPAAHAGIKDAGLKAFHGYLKEIDGLYAGKDWLFGDFSVVDPYAFVFYTWGIRRELPVHALKNYTAFKDRMLKRPAVQRVVEDEKVKV